MPNLSWTQRQLPLSQEQFSDAFRKGYPLTLRFLMSRGAPSDLAEEVAQGAWAKGWECRAQLRTPHMVGAWVNSIAKNMLKNSVRLGQRQEALSESTQSGGPTVLSLDLKRILHRCDRRDSAILRGYYVEGYTTEEIAQRIGLAPVTVRVRLLRIRRALSTQFAPIQKAA